MEQHSTGTVDPRIAKWTRVLEFAIVLLAASLPFALRIMPLFILGIAVAVIALRVLHGRGGWRRLSPTSAMPWMALFYLLHVLGMAWTTNTAFGLFDLEVKASFLLFPVLFMVLPDQVQVDRTRILQAFAVVNAIAVLICLVAAIARFVPEWSLRQQDMLPAGAPWTNHFFESRFALFLHPSYMAMYLCFALAALHLGVAGAKQRFNGVLSAVLIVGVILCNSKMGWLTLTVVIVLALADAWRERAVRRRLALLSGIGLVLFTGLFRAFPTVSGKITQAFNATGAIDPGSDQSSALRRMAWDAATDLFAAQPATGVGTGDIKDDLIAVYHAKGYVHAEAKRMNAHSQFLQSAAALGIGGLLVLVAMIVLPLARIVRRRDLLACSFWIVLLLNWTVESMAEVQAGVMFTVLMAWMLEAGRRV